MTGYAFGETVVRLRRGPSPGRDARGQPIPGALQETPITGVVVTPRQDLPEVGGEQQQARDTVIRGYTVYDPHRTEWRATDQVRIRGEVCEITGQPGDWGVSPFTGMPGCVQFAADRVSG